MKSKPSNNEFTIKIANVNGTGSASANGLLMKSLFRMGIPVVGKNYFPSNIQGLPTWYEIRVSDRGHLARSGRVDIMIAMNAETYKKDLGEVAWSITRDGHAAGKGTIEVSMAANVPGQDNLSARIQGLRIP